MKKFLWVGLTTISVVIGLSMLSPVGAVRAPVDAQGHALGTISFIGAYPCNIDSSTGTSPVLCGSAGAAIVYGVILSSVSTTNFLVLRDTNTANITSSTAAVVFANPQVSTSTVGSGASITQMITFPVPLLFNNGICGVVSSTTTAGTGVWTVLYRPRNQIGE